MDESIEVKLEKQQNNGKNVQIKSKYIDAISKSKVSGGTVEKAESGLQRKKTFMGTSNDEKFGNGRSASKMSMKRSGTIKQQAKGNMDDDLM